MALKYGKKVCVKGFFGGVTRVIKDEKETITHLDVEISGVIDRYSIHDVVVLPKYIKNNE